MEERGAPLPLRNLASADKAPQLKDALLKRRGGDLVIDGSGVEMLSGLALEALISARATWRLDGSAMSISSPSEQMRRDVELLGMSALLTAEEDKAAPGAAPATEGDVS